MQAIYHRYRRAARPGEAAGLGRVLQGHPVSPQARDGPSCCVWLAEPSASSSTGLGVDPAYLRIVLLRTEVGLDVPKPATLGHGEDAPAAIRLRCGTTVLGFSFLVEPDGNSGSVMPPSNLTL